MRHPAVEAFRGGDGLIRIVGHRGARGDLPENSIPGFEYALSEGVNLLEFDVVMTSDGIPVVTHNHRLHAPTFRSPIGAFLDPETPKVSDLSWSDIQKYDIGRLDPASDYGRRFPDQRQMDGVRVPRLAELLDLVATPEHPDAHLMLEMKSDPDLAGEGGYRSGFIETVVAEVRGKGLDKRTLLHSFDHELLAECRRLAPDMPLSYLTRVNWDDEDVGEDSAKAVSSGHAGPGDGIPDRILEAGGSVWCPHVGDVNEKDLARARELGLCVAVWTVNGKADIDRMAALGVDAIVTDYPGRVRERLAERGIRC